MKKTLLSWFLTGASILSFQFNTFSQCGVSFEPNESISAAPFIGLNTNIQAAITTTSDQDYFKIMPGISGGITIKLTNLPLDYDLHLLNEAGNVVLTSINGGNANDVILAELTGGNVYYIRVFGYQGNNSESCYSLITEYNSQTCPEPIPDNTIATAAFIPYNSSVTGGITTNTDHDYYKISVDIATVLNFTLTNLPFDYDLELFNSSGTKIASSIAGGTTSESITTSGAIKGDFYLHVFGYQGVYSKYSCYTLSNSTVCGNNYEPNENLGSATIINDTAILGAINSSADLDYYSLSLGNGAYAYLYNPPVDLDLELYNSAGNLVAISNNSGNSSDIVYAPGKGNYYLLVKGKTGAYSPNCYYVKINPGSQLREEINTEGTMVSQENNLILFPQPVKSGQVVFLYNLKNENTDLKIVDLKGTIVRQQMVSSANGTAEILLNDFVPGVYYLNTGSGVKKLIVQ